MPRRYLDEMVPINSGILGQYISPVGPFREPMYAMVDNDTIAVTPISTRTRSKSKKKKTNKPKNDGIIRNHDSVWDYKIQDGKLLSRRKTSDGKWYDITNNEEARNRIESFTNSNISRSNVVIDKQSSVRPDNKQLQGSVTVQSEPKQNPISSLSNYIGSKFVPQPINQTGSYIQDFTNVGTANSKILSSEDLLKNNWHWGGVEDINFEGVSNDLYADAINRAQTQGGVLLDKNGRPVTSRQVNRYVGLKDYQPASRMSVSDMALYQPQSENSTLQDVRRAQDFRRNREFDKQRNAALATMFGLPLAGIGAAEALAAGPVLAGGAYLGSDLGGKITNVAMQKLYGRTWDEISDDPNVNFYAQLLNPGRWIGGAVGGYGGRRLQYRMQHPGEYPNLINIENNHFGVPVNTQSRMQQNQAVQMLLDPRYQEPVVQGVAPGYGVIIPSRNITHQPPKQIRFEPEGTTRFENWQRRIQGNNTSGRSIKTEQPKANTKQANKSKAKGTKKAINKRERERIIKAAYEQAYQ